jgi:hypothetical protein
MVGTNGLGETKSLGELFDDMRAFHWPHVEGAKPAQSQAAITSRRTKNNDGMRSGEQSLAHRESSASKGGHDDW